MKTRKSSRSGDEVSLLGFGCMRLPLQPDGRTIDEKQTARMVDYAFRNGVNYFDTAWGYHSGESETVMGKILKGYPRDRFFLADKMPTYLVRDRRHAEEIFARQLEKCRVEYFDYYLLHTLDTREEYERVYEENGVYAYLQEEKTAGRIRRLGFSFHGTVPVFEYLLDRHDWDFAQIQLNYLDWQLQDAGLLYRMLEERRLPCIVMEPVRGGALANLNPAATGLLRQAEPERSPAAWAIRFAASPPQVLTVLSGMSNMEQLKDNVAALSDFQPLSEAEHQTLKQALELYRQSHAVPCTDCRYCLPCPFGVNIPRIFGTYNLAAAAGIPAPSLPHDEEFERKAFAMVWGYELIPAENRAEGCTRCGRCEPLCPQHIAIPDELRKISELVAALQ